MIVTNQDQLRIKSKRTSRWEVRHHKLVDLVHKELQKAWTTGCGLAAVQVGLPIRAAVYFLDVETFKDPHVLINPEILEGSNWKTIKEGCLSIPDTWTNVERFHNIKYVNDGKVCEAEGFEAQVIQHEIDHMDGILNIDRAHKNGSVGRNSPCPCGSGLKYKKCCLDAVLEKV